MQENLNIEQFYAELMTNEIPVTKNIQQTKINDIEKSNVVNEPSQEDDVTEESETSEEQEKTEPQALPKEDLKVEYESLKKQLNDAKSWGHKKNSAYINAKKKITDFLGKLQEDSLLNEDEVSFALKAFDDKGNENETIQNDKGANIYEQMRANLDKEFSIFKKYNKDPELDAKYQSFFGFFPLLTQEEQEKVVNYIQEENPEIAIDHIITTGADIYETVFKGASKSGGIIPFVKSLHSKINNLEKRNKELERAVDSTEGIVHNRSISSKVSNLNTAGHKKFSYADLWSDD